MAKYVVSSIGPSNTSIGNLVEEFMDINNRYNLNYEFVYRSIPSKSNIKKAKNVKKFKIFFNTMKKIFRMYSLFKFSMKIRKIKDSDVMILHPQTIGIKNVKKLIRNNVVKYYIVDNSYFCIKSYNHFKNEFKECNRCLNSNNFIENINCKSNPVFYKKSTYNSYLKFLLKNSSRIKFLVQNQSQSTLLKKHFGLDIDVKVIGLYTKEINLDINHKKRMRSIEKPSITEFDIIYHAGKNEAKGILYFIEIAKKLPEIRFFIPEDINVITSIHENIIIPKNIIFKSMRWETGLREHVENSKIIMCPSLWSAPVEVALIKSIMYNGCVAAYNSKYSFVSELNDDVIIKLNENIASSVIELKNILDSKSRQLEYKAKSLSWLQNYVKLKNQIFVNQF